MGYTTDFKGRFDLDRPLDKELKAYLFKFAETRRMARNLPDEYGIEGEFYVEGGGEYGQAKDNTIIEHNTPPSTQPGLWCQWVPTKDGTGIEWDGGEKFYEYTKWLLYIIKNFLEPKGYVLNGSVKWQGEDPRDFGVLEVKQNKLIEHHSIRTL